MNIFYKILYFLQGQMNRPSIYGWFHIMWIVLVIISLIFLYKRKDKYNEKQLKLVLGIYGIIAFILELLKQLIWSFNYDPLTNIVTWDYNFYAFPFQLCTTPIYVSIICLFLKKNKIRTSLLSYMSFTTILGSIATIIYPESCFTKDILVNIHTMYLHCGSLVVSIYLLMMKEVKITKENLIKGFIVFLIFLNIAQILNVVVYNSGILKGEVFDMFYISRHFISALPIFNIIQENTPFIIFLLLYILAIFIGSYLVYKISYYIENLSRKSKN